MFINRVVMFLVGSGIAARVLYRLGQRRLQRERRRELRRQRQALMRWEDEGGTAVQPSAAADVGPVLPRRAARTGVRRAAASLQ